MLTANSEEAVLCVLVLKGVDIHMAKQMSASICSTARYQPMDIAEWWVFSALRSTFQVDDDPSRREDSPSVREKGVGDSPFFPLFHKAIEIVEEKRVSNLQ